MTTVDQQRADAFAGQMLAALNNSATVLMLSVGHRTGLFQALSKLPPATSAEIANVAGLEERYVREWLGNMVVSRIVDYDPVTRQYTLPAEHAMYLTPEAGPNNMAAYADAIPVFAGVVGPVAECFRRGGGVPYAAVPNIQEVIAGLTTPLYDAYLIDSILPFVGLDERLDRGAAVADIGCGQGHAVNLMAKAYPKSTFTGFDFSDEGVAAARREAESWGLTNAKFDVRDVANLGIGDLTSSLHSMPFTTRLSPIECFGTSGRRSGPAGSTSCSTKRARATWKRTSTIRSAHFSTRPPSYTA